MSYRSLDPIRDAERYYNYLEERLEKRPRCSCCKEHIQEESAIQINGEWICHECEMADTWDIWNRVRENYLVNIEEE